MKKKDLLKLIVDLQDRVIRLENENRTRQVPQWPLIQSPVTVPTIQFHACIDGGLHEYPSPWMGIFPPPCKKCGKAGPDFTKVTCSTGTVTSAQVGLEPIGKESWRASVIKDDSSTEEY